MIFFRKKDNPSTSSGRGEKTRAHIFVSGRVQGVFYRETVRKKAEKLSITGWVKNLKDGRVEAVLEGEKENVQNLVNWAKRGPIWAKVKDLEILWEDHKAEFQGFEIKYDL